MVMVGKTRLVLLPSPQLIVLLLLLASSLLAAATYVPRGIEAEWNTSLAHGADDFVSDVQGDRADDRFAMEREMLNRMFEEKAQQEEARREQRRRVHLLFLETHQRVSARKPPSTEELFPPSLRADYLRMRRIVKIQRGGGTLLHIFVTLLVWTAPFAALVVWQLL